MAVRTEIFTGAAIAPFVAALARLRIEVFRDWPYLYDGNEGEEHRHLAAFSTSPDAALVVALDGEEPVGCSTCLPLAHEPANIRAPFEARGWDTRRFCYFSESVLRGRYRGQGIGVAFFAAREAHARTLEGCDFATFCGVRRAPDDPRRPADAVPLDAFWRRRGFQPVPGLACTMTWPELGRAGEQVNTLDFWIKSLRGAALP
jgi:GNAT superfamily N-acetyltransferase